MEAPTSTPSTVSVLGSILSATLRYKWFSLLKQVEKMFIRAESSFEKLGQVLYVIGHILDDLIRDIDKVYCIC